MKYLALTALLSLAVSNAFADHHEEQKKKQGHDKEHTHVEGAKMDHDHEDGHHQDHDHKAHHPDHKEMKTKKNKK
jgi:hypothetical protein